MTKTNLEVVSNLEKEKKLKGEMKAAFEKKHFFFSKSNSEKEKEQKNHIFPSSHMSRFLQGAKSISVSSVLLY